MMTSLGGGGRLLGLLLTLTAHGLNASPTATDDGVVYGDVRTNSYETNRGVLRTKQISDGGDSLLIGSEPVEDKGDAETLVTCTRHQDITDYKDHHQTEILKRAANTYESLPAEGPATIASYDEYFVYLRKDLWSCKTNDGKLKFYRIVNHLLGVKEIRGIKYHEGVQVITRHYLGDQKTAEIKEVKYMMMEQDNRKYIRYLGKFKEARKRDDIEVVADAAGTESLVSDRMAKPGQSTHVTELHETSETHEIHDEGIHLVVKYNYPSDATQTSNATLGKATSKASCVPEQGIHPFPKQYRLTFFEKIIVEEKPYDAVILEEERHEYFIPINQEIWLCQTEEARMEERKIFFRVVNEVIGRKGVKKLTAHEGVNSIMKIKLFKSNQIAIRLKEVRYIDALSYTDIKYLGQIRLKGKDKFERKYKNKKGEMPFVLNDNRVFRLLVSSEGFDIRFGQRWLREHPSTVKRVVCFKDAEYKYKDSYRTKLNVIASMETDSSKTFSLESPDNYRNHPIVTYITQEVSLCRAPGGENQFLRVFNELKVVEPVHEVEFYDGVFVSDYVFTGLNSKSVYVIEIKFLSLKDEHVIKYEGEVGVQEYEGETPTLLTDDTKSMKVTEEDIVWSVGHFPDVNMNEEDRRKFIQQNSIPYDREGQFKVKKNGKWKLEFGDSSEYVRKIQKRTGQAVCQRLRETTEIKEIIRYRLRPRFLDISGTDVVTSQLLESNKDKFFEKSKTEFWTCKEEYSGAVQFVLVKSEFILNHDGFTGSLKSGDKTYKNLNNIGVYQLNKKSYARFNFVMLEGQSHFAIFDDTKFYGLTGNHYHDSQYEGELIFTADSQPKKSGTFTLVASQDEIALNVVPITRDIEYRAYQDWTYNSVLDESGTVSLQIGNKWKKVIFSSHDVKTCRKRETIDEGRFAASFRTKIKNLIQEPGQEKLHNQQLFDEYFEIIKQEVWECGEPELKFLRVLNHFHVKPHHCNSIKEVTYYDGVTIMLGMIDSQTCTEIVEIKYLDAGYYTPLKYEGKVVLHDKNNKEITIDGIKAKKLQQVAKLENYYLPKDQAYKKFISKNGVVLEIGVQKEKIINVPYLVCEKTENPLPVHENKYMPVIRVSTTLRVNMVAKPVELDYIQRHFSTIVELWNCTYNGKIYTRAVAVLTKLKGDELTVAEILNYDGVTIDVYPKLTIQEIKFFEDTDHIKPMRIAGFVHLKGDQRTQEISAERVYYKLDAHRLAVTEVSKRGPVMDVGSIPEETFGTRDDHIWCDKITNPTFQPQYKTKVYMSPEQSTASTELDVKNFKDYFDTMEEEVWKCYGKQAFAFERIVSVHIAIKDIARMFVADGITVGEQIFPDNSRSKKITEIKYLKQEGGTYKPLKYEGKITLQSDYNFVEATLFQMPTKYREIAIESSDRAVSARHTKYWPMEVLRAYARQKPATNRDLPIATYNSQPKREIFETGGNNLEVGSTHESTLLVKDEDPMRCLLDQWNPINEQRFLTKMKLHFDDKTYELDRDTILEYFDVKLIEVWICVNKDQAMLRVVTKLQGVKKFHSIRSHDGIEFEEFKLDNGGASLKITEIKYMDGRTFEVLKFTKPLKEIEKVVITKPGSTRSKAESAGRQSASAGSRPGSARTGPGSPGNKPGSAGSGPGSAGSGTGSEAGSARSGPGSARNGPGSPGNKAGSAGSGLGSARSVPVGAGRGPPVSARSVPVGAGSGPGSPVNKVASTGSGPESTRSGPESAGSGPGSARGGTGSGPGRAGTEPGSAGTGPGSAGTGSGSAGSGPGNAGTGPGSAENGHESSDDEAGSGHESSDDEAESEYESSDDEAESGHESSDDKAGSSRSRQGNPEDIALTYSFEPSNPSRQWTAWHILFSWFRTRSTESE